MGNEKWLLDLQIGVGITLQGGFENVPPLKPPIRSHKEEEMVGGMRIGQTTR